MFAAAGNPASRMEAGSPTESQASAAGRALAWQNWSNLAAYVVNVIITYISLTGLFGATNTDLSKKYQTLVTPAGWAFSIWGIIFLSEGAFVVAQMLPRYRARQLVQASTCWWLAACLFQCCWTVAFAQEVIWLSVVFMLSILASLLGMALRADFLTFNTEEYLLLRAPFAVHLGWIICASAVNVNVMADAAGAPPGTLLGLAIASLAAILAAVTAFTLATKHAEPLIGTVAAWAFLAVASELGSPQNLLDPARFNPYYWDDVTLAGVRFAAVATCVAAAAMATVAAARKIWAAVAK